MRCPHLTPSFISPHLPLPKSHWPSFNFFSKPSCVKSSGHAILSAKHPQLLRNTYPHTQPTSHYPSALSLPRMPTVLGFKIILHESGCVSSLWPLQKNVLIKSIVHFLINGMFYILKTIVIIEWIKHKPSAPSPTAHSSPIPRPAHLLPFPPTTLSVPSPCSDFWCSHLIHSHSQKTPDRTTFLTKSGEGDPPFIMETLRSHRFKSPDTLSQLGVSDL